MRSLLGYSAFAGVATTVVMFPLQRSLSKRAIRLTENYKAAGDQRLEACRSVIEGIRLWKTCVTPMSAPTQLTLAQLRLGGRVDGSLPRRA